MISVVCVFNNAELLERRLLRSLKQQSVGYELLCADNRNEIFRNGATALNATASRAKGEWIIFVHQDVEFLSRAWLAKAESTLENLNAVGWVGVAGRTRDGGHRGFLRNCAALQGLPFDGAVEVQTLDELLLIHRRVSGESKYFDELVPGWHAYGVEGCCNEIRKGRKNYVLSLPVWHDSPGANLAGLKESHQYVWRKHGASLGKIYTTCGALPSSRPKSGGLAVAYLRRAMRRIRNLNLYLLGFQSTSLTWFHETLDSITQSSILVHCLHDYANQDPIEAAGFSADPKHDRPIIHTFSAFDTADLQKGDVVIAPDLAARLSDDTVVLEHLRNTAGRLFVCLSIEQLKSQPRLWRWLRDRSAGHYLTLDKGGERMAVVEMSRASYRNQENDTTASEAKEVQVVRSWTTRDSN